MTIRNNLLLNHWTMNIWLNINSAWNKWMPTWIIAQYTSCGAEVHNLISWKVNLIGEKIRRVVGISWRPTGCSMGILHKAKGNYLDWVHSDQKALKVIRQGRLVLVIEGQASHTQLKRPLGLSQLRSDGSSDGSDGQAGGWSLWVEAELKGYTLLGKSQREL